MSLKDDKEFLIMLYEESFNHLEEDFKLVKNNTTKSLIAEEIKMCEKRLAEIRNF